MRIVASVISHPGKCREKNEDNFCFNGKKLIGSCTRGPVKYNGSTSKPVLMGIFDGMGGIKAGERASFITADVACKAIEKIEKVSDFEQFQIDICKEANELICNEMINVIKQRIGTTLSMLCFFNEEYHLCNVGDSPVFLFRDKQLKTIFYEHSEKMNFLKIYGSDAVLPKKKFKLTQNIGIFQEEMEIEPYVLSDQIRKGDRFIIASDGLTDMVDESTIVQILEQRVSPGRTVNMLLKQALDNGGRDNITIICIDIK